MVSFSFLPLKLSLFVKKKKKKKEKKRQCQVCCSSFRASSCSCLLVGVCISLGACKQSCLLNKRSCSMCGLFALFDQSSRGIRIRLLRDFSGRKKSDSESFCKVMPFQEDRQKMTKIISLIVVDVVVNLARFVPFHSIYNAVLYMVVDVLRALVCLK